jgi:hypothetical protein
MKVILIISFIVFLVFSSSAEGIPVNLLQIGISGDIDELVIESLTQNSETVLVGTTTGTYVFSSDLNLLRYIQVQKVKNILVIDDITGDGQKDIVVTTDDRYFPNILAYDVASGEKIWEFSSKMEIYDMDMLWTTQQAKAFEISKIQDVNNDGYSDIVVSSGYSVYLLSGKTGKEIWEFKGKDNLWDLSVISDTNKNGVQDILTGSQDGYIYLIDGKGDTIWSKLLAEKYTVINPNTNTSVATVARSVWDIVPLEIDGKQKIFVSVEDGYVYKIDLETREIEWKEQIIQYTDLYLFEYYGGFIVPTYSGSRNFFNLMIKVVDDVTGDDNSDILVSTWSGQRLYGADYKGKTEELYLLNSKDGKTVWSNKNIELTYINELETVKTVGKTYLLIPIEKSGYGEKIKMIDIKDGSLYKTITINSSSDVYRFNLYFVKEFGNNFLLASNYGDILTSDYDGIVKYDYPRINSIITDYGDLTGDTTQDLLVKSKNNAEAEEYLDEGQARAIAVVDGGTKEVVWSYVLPFKTFVETGGFKEVQIIPDLDKDGKSDIATYVQAPEEVDEFGNTTRIVAFSGKDGSILLNTSITNKTYYGGWEEFYKDLNASVTKQVLNEFRVENIDQLPAEGRELFNQRCAERFSQYSERKGDLMIKKRIYSLDIIQDKTGDNIPDFLVSSWNDLFIIDSLKGSIVWNKTRDAQRYQNPWTGDVPKYLEWGRNWTKHDRVKFKVLGDINNDKMDDLVLIDWDGVLILLSNTTSFGLDYSPSERVTIKGIDKEGAKTIPDSDDDGIKEIMFRKCREDTPCLYDIISGKTRNLIFEAERRGVDIELNVADFDGDGSEDSIVFYKWSEKGKELNVVSGKTGKVLWTYTEYDELWDLESLGYDTFMPAAPVSDMNNDGRPDIAVVKTLSWQRGALVLIYDVLENKLIKTIIAEATDPTAGDKRWVPSATTAMLPDLTGDGVQEIGFIGALGESVQKEVKLVVVDVANSKVVSDFTMKGIEIVKFGNGIGVIGQSGDIYSLEIENDLKIKSPKSGEVLSSPINLEWERTTGEFKNMILVDNIKILRTENNTITLDIPEGKHTIEVYSFDKYGKGVYDGIEVSIVKSSSAFLISGIVTLLLVILFSPHIYSLILKIKRLVKK